MPAVPSLPPAPYRRRRARRPTSLPDCSSRTTDHSPLPTTHGCLSPPNSVHYSSKRHTSIPNARRPRPSTAAPPTSPVRRPFPVGSPPRRTRPSSLAPRFAPPTPRPPPVRGEPVEPRTPRTPRSPVFSRCSHLCPRSSPALHPSFRRPQPESSLRPPTHPEHPEKHPAPPQEFFRKSSYCAREPRFRHPAAQRHRPRPRRPAQAVPHERPSSPLPLRLPRPVGEGREEGFPGAAPRLTRVDSGHSNRVPNPAKKGPASPQEFFRKNSYCAREPRFSVGARPVRRAQPALGA